MAGTLVRIANVVLRPDVPGHNRENVNVFWYSTLGAAVAANLENVRSAWVATIGSLWGAATEDVMPAGQATVTCYDDPTIMPAVGVGSPVGGIAATAAPPQIAVRINLRTAINGRSYRGIKLIGGVSNSSIESNGSDLNAGGQTLFDNLLAGMCSDFTDSDGFTWYPVIFSPTLTLVTGSLTPVVTPVSVVNSFTENKLSSLRRRRGDSHG